MFTYVSIGPLCFLKNSNETVDAVKGGELFYFLLCIHSVSVSFNVDSFKQWFSFLFSSDEQYTIKSGTRRNFYMKTVSENSMSPRLLTGMLLG